MNYLFLISMLLSAQCIGKQLEKDHASLKRAMTQVYAALKNNKTLTTNPLQGHTFDRFSSRSYLYFYRAQAYANLAKASNVKLSLLEHALSDLRNAKSAPLVDTQRIEALTTLVIKDKIEVLHAQKKYALVVDTIEQLSPKDRSDARTIVYFAHALFRSSQIESFKRFARANNAILTNKTTLTTYLNVIPDWHSVATEVTVPRVTSLAPSSGKPSAVTFTKDMMLTDPKILDLLDAKTYFKSTDKLFKIASNLYFAVVNKNTRSAAEKKFLATFRRKMHNFAPGYIDTLITSFWKFADLKTAKMLSRTFLDRFIGHPLYPKTLYNFGRIQEDSKDYQPAAKTFKNFIAISDDATYLELARFRLPWVLYLAKKDDAAKPYFEEYVKTYPEGRYVSTSEYILLKICPRTQLAEQQALVTAFIKKYPLNLYAFLLADEHNLSSNILRETLSAQDTLAQNRTIQDFKADIATLTRLKIYEELKDFGLNDDAIKVLKSISFDTNNASLNLYLASQFQELADTHGQVSNLIKVASLASPERELVPWKGLFPDYQTDAIKHELAQQNVGLSSLLILALIRQESAFDSNAQSRASAYGLMQLTKGMANAAATQLQLKNFSLFDVNDNLRLGIRTFSELVKKYGRVDYALCAYNAGETPTNLWIALRGHLDPIKFIESIPYPETRIYVKGILRNWAIYRMLYAENPSPLVMFAVDRPSHLRM